MQEAEPPLLVFVSSVMGVEDLADERRACKSTIDSLELTRAWAFEFSPASADPAEDTYLEKVDQCDIFVVLLGSELTDATEHEYERAVLGEKPRLLFVRNTPGRSARAADWLRQRQDVKWAVFEGVTNLAQQVRAAVCDELIKAYRRFHLKPKDFETIAIELRSEPVTYMVRTIQSNELATVTETLPELQARYPHFDRWIQEKALQITRNEAAAYVASLGEDNPGFALVTNKDPGVRKISTLFIKEDFRGMGVGPRLLFGVMERAARDRIEKLYITLSEELRAKFERLLDQYGFSVEGVSARRYRDNSWEWVWSKRLIHGRLRPRHLAAFVRRYMFEERGFTVETAGPGVFLAKPLYDALGRPSDGEVSLLIATAATEHPDNRYRAACRQAEELGLQLIFVSIEPLAEVPQYGTCLDGLDIEARYFPLYVERNIEGLIVPIRESFAQMLIPRSDEPQFLVPTRVQLSTANVYYRWPSAFAGLRRGSPLFFYETQRRHGQSRLIGEGRLVECAVDEPKELLAKYGNLGVYTLEDVERCVMTRGPNSGKALALRFDWYREIPVPLNRRQIEEVFPTFDPTTARRLQAMDVLELRKRIGWNVDALSLP
jgi:ribosomal protein S18 acetylase RimI-like enzyme